MIEKVSLNMILTIRDGDDLAKSLLPVGYLFGANMHVFKSNIFERG